MFSVSLIIVFCSCFKKFRRKQKTCLLDKQGGFLAKFYLYTHLNIMRPVCLNGGLYAKNVKVRHYVLCFFLEDIGAKQLVSNGFVMPSGRHRKVRRNR